MIGLLLDRYTLPYIYDSISMSTSIHSNQLIPPSIPLVIGIASSFVALAKMVFVDA
jgi:hypothetical protein